MTGKAVAIRSEVKTIVGGDIITSSTQVTRIDDPEGPGRRTRIDKKTAAVMDMRTQQPQTIDFVNKQGLTSAKDKMVKTLQQKSELHINELQAGMITQLAHQGDNEFNRYVTKKYTENVATMKMLHREGYFYAEAYMDKVMHKGKASLTASEYNDLKEYYHTYYRNRTDTDFETFLETLSSARGGDSEAAISAFYTKEALLYADYDFYSRTLEATTTSLMILEAALPASGLRISGGSVRFSAPRPVPKGNGNFLKKPTAGDNVGSNLRAKGTGNSLTKIDNYVDLTGHRKDHILNRHRAGAGKPEKTEFPASWSDDRILHQVSDVASDPNAIRGVGKYDSPYAIGVRDGIEIRVDFYPNNHKYAGQISTAYPTNVPANPSK